MSRVEKTKRGKLNKKRIAIASGILAAIILLGIVGGMFLINNKKPAEQKPVPVVTRKITSFQEAVDAEYTAQSANFVGEEAELDIVIRTFATNFFTLWGVQNSSDYNGQGFIAEEFKANFDKNVQNNLLFRFPALVEEYGAENLPIATNVVYDAPEFQTMYINEMPYTSYTTRIYMEYQDGTKEGTKHADQIKADALLQKWVASARITFYFVPNETGNGYWHVGAMKHMLSIENRDRDISEYIYEGDVVSTPGPVEEEYTPAPEVESEPEPEPEPDTGVNLEE